MTFVCKYIGGSKSYGLDTPTSDNDLRGIFLNTEIKYILGLDKYEHQIIQNGQSDESYKEFRHVLKLLRNANTECVEMLYNDTWLVLSPFWIKVQSYREKLVDSTKLFNCLRGYMAGELKLTLGLRTGKLGGKRHESLEKFGYSPKNAVQAIRLMWAGATYFSSGYFPVNVAKEDSYLAARLLDIKVNPQKYNVKEIEERILIAEKDMIQRFENRSKNTTFDENLANDLCIMAYAEIVKKNYNRLLAPQPKKFMAEQFEFKQ